MRIALDYDGTYTADPALWDAFIENATKRGHQVFVVTMRYPREEIDRSPIPVIYTSRQAKHRFCEDAGMPSFDIWIDDNPFWILHGATG